MSQLLPCPQCQRHLKSDEDICPFCAKPVDFSGVGPHVLPRARLSRAATFAFSATLVGALGSACGEAADDPDVATGGGGARPVGGFTGTGGAIYGAPPMGGSGQAIYGAPASGGFPGTGGAVSPTGGTPGAGGTGGSPATGGTSGEAGAAGGAIYGGPPAGGAGGAGGDPGASAGVYGAPPSGGEGGG